MEVSTKAKSQAAGLGTELHSVQHLTTGKTAGQGTDMELSTLACKAEEVERCEDEARKGVLRIEDCKRRGRQCISATSTLTVEQKCILNFQTEP